MTVSTEVKIYSTAKKAYKALAKEIYKTTKISSQKRIDIALSGGNSPIQLFKKIKKKYAELISWDRVHFWWGDERCVPQNDDQSNYKWANEFLLSGIPIPDKNIHRIKGENIPAKEAILYANEIKKNLNHRGEIPVFDIVILGLGEDGHTASIFPNQLDLFKTNDVCAVSKHPETGQTRITLTGKVINNASRIFFLVTGENKAGRISEIMDDDEKAELLPAYHVVPENGSLIWFLDEEAASKII